MPAMPLMPALPPMPAAWADRPSSLRTSRPPGRPPPTRAANRTSRSCATSAPAGAGPSGPLPPLSPLPPLPRTSPGREAPQPARSLATGDDRSRGHESALARPPPHGAARAARRPGDRGRRPAVPALLRAGGRDRRARTARQGRRRRPPRRRAPAAPARLPGAPLRRRATAAAARSRAAAAAPLDAGRSLAPAGAAGLDAPGRTPDRHPGQGLGERGVDPPRAPQGVWGRLAGPAAGGVRRQGQGPGRKGPVAAAHEGAFAARAGPGPGCRAGARRRPADRHPRRRGLRAGRRARPDAARLSPWQGRAHRAQQRRFP